MMGQKLEKSIPSISELEIANLSTLVKIFKLLQCFCEG